MISRTLLLDLVHLCNVELAPTCTYDRPWHAPMPDIGGVVETRARLLDELAEQEMEKVA